MSHRPFHYNAAALCLAGLALLLSSPRLFAEDHTVLDKFAVDANWQKGVTGLPNSRPFVYWYWLNGDITRQGITADLEAMKNAGIGGVAIFNVGAACTGPLGSVQVLSPEWRELMKHALNEAGRLGLQVDLNNSMAGWSSSGGPWVTPEMSMQRLTFSETQVSGGAKRDLDLPQPPTNLSTYRDVAVIAFPTPEAELADQVGNITSSDPQFDLKVTEGNDTAPPGGRNLEIQIPHPPKIARLRLNAGDGPDAFIQWTYPNPFAARALHLVFEQGGASGKLEASDDGQQWRSTAAFEYGGPNSQDVEISFTGAPAARFWRVVFPSKTARTIGVLEIKLSHRASITAWTGKAMFDNYGLLDPKFTPQANAAPEDSVIPQDKIIDLSSQMKSPGHLSWEVPQGEWTIMRFGYTPTGITTEPCDVDSGGGLEVDKFNQAALDVHWKNSLQPWLDDPQLKKLIQYAHIDSYERGMQNWTGRMPEFFQERKGYDMRAFLPVLSGRVVGSTLTSERFLWDFRNVITGLWAENYHGHFAELCRENGIKFTLEPYHQNQFNNITSGGKADIPMTECWAPDTMDGSPGAPYWRKLGASPAHLYNKQLVGAESFTANGRGGGNWSADFWYLKQLGDTIFTGGVNLMMLHVYAHQPQSVYPPGRQLTVFGTHFERMNTWWGQMPAFTSYISRCQAFLQKGRFVADVLYSCGENSPNKGLELQGRLDLPDGYDYDVADPQSLYENVKVINGKLVRLDGGSYRMLVLPDGETMTLPMIRRIREFVQAGAVVVGPKPLRSPSETGQPAVDSEVRKIADELWDGGKVISNQSVKQVLAQLSIAPDFEARTAKALVRYIHREFQGADLYYVANSSLQPQTVQAVFRSSEGAVRLMDPVTGEVRDLPEVTSEAGRTKVPMQFEPRQSFFVLIDHTTKRKEAGSKNFADTKPLIELSGPWEVSFDPKWGGPTKITFNELEDWTKRPEEGIKFYSGMATYRKTFDAPEPTASRRMFLDVGTVKNIAVARLNGRTLGTIWCAPWRAEIPMGLLREKNNVLEIDAINLWPNRLIGDEQLPDDCEWKTYGAWQVMKNLPAWYVHHTPRQSERRTFTTFKHWHKGDGLLPSGLLGPVKVLIQN
jgi:hypothetical protein